MSRSTSGYQPVSRDDEPVIVDLTGLGEHESVRSALDNAYEKVESCVIEEAQKPTCKGNKNMIRFMGQTYKLPPQNARHFPYTNLPALGFMFFELYSLLHVWYLYNFYQEKMYILIPYAIMLVIFPLWCIGTICYFVAMLTPPGSPRPHSKPIERTPQEEAELMDTAKVATVGWCDKCNNAKPERTHHCSYCETCVLRMDHHCPWIHNCVGNNNHKAFFLMLSYGKIFGMFTTALLAYASFLIWYDGLDVNRRELQILINTWTAFIVTLWLSALSYGQTMLLFNNKTTLESFSYRTAGMQGKPWYNPYDARETHANASQILGGTLLEQINPLATSYIGDGHAFLKYPPPPEFLVDYENYRAGITISTGSSSCCGGGHAH